MTSTKNKDQENRSLRALCDMQEKANDKLFMENEQLRAELKQVKAELDAFKAFLQNWHEGEAD